MHDEVNKGWWDREIFECFASMLSSSPALSTRASA
jgi:hypothetical protein